MQPGDVIDGRFELLVVRGAGGMGRVFEAREASTGRKVALKTLLASGGSTERFEREGAALARLSHPNIVKYVASGREDDGSPWLAMEWLDGEDLATRLGRGALSVEETLTLARGVASALDAAHARSLVHRDIKPANLFLPAGDAARVKVLDFGVARALDGARATATGAMLGTLGYMAPEQARGSADVGPCSDLFSLGCVLYECLASTPAFRGDHPVAILGKILLESPPALSELGVTVPRGLERLVEQLLEKDPVRRPPSARAVLDALDAPDDPTPRDEARPRHAAVGGDEQTLVSLVVVAAAASAHEDTVLEAREDEYRDRVSEVIAAHGGRPERMMGGTQIGTVVVDGTARDHARQAARCALAVRAVAPDARIALATGRTPGAGVLGEVMDRGAALFRAPPIASPGTSAIEVDETTAALVRDDFRLVEHEDRWFLVGEAPAQRAPRSTVLCVGRDREIANVLALMEECASEEVARAALLVGPPGIGKSRLVEAVLDRAPGDALVWRAEADPIGAGSPHRLVGRLALSAAGLRGGESAADKREQLRALATRHVPASRAAFVGAALAAACGADAEDGGARPSAEDIRRAWEELVSGALGSGPLTLVLEDIHWADQTSLTLVDRALRDHQAQGAGARPLFVLATARPDVRTTFPRLWADRAVEELRLTELGLRAATRLVEARLGRGADPAAVRGIVERAAGNAFFLVELARTVASGHKETIPDTVMGVVEARLRAFEPEDRRTLRAASVFGQHFFASGVASLLGAAAEDATTLRLDALVERDVLRKDDGDAGIYGDGATGPALYAFAHALIRDAAYAMLTEDDRRTAHLAAAAWLELEGAGDLASLAHHVEQGADRARAVECYLSAAREASNAGDFDAAVAHADRAFALGAEGEIRGRAFALRSEAFLFLGEKEDAIAAAKEAMKLLPPGSEAWFWASRVAMGFGFVRAAKEIS